MTDDITVIPMNSLRALEKARKNKNISGLFDKLLDDYKKEYPMLDTTIINKYAHRHYSLVMALLREYNKRVPVIKLKKQKVSKKIDENYY